MTDADLLWLDATAQADLIRKRELKPSELLDAVLRRIDSVNPQVNAVTRRMDDSARKEIAGSLPQGPFTGVPFLIKDLLAGCAGVPTSCGSKFANGLVPPRDTELVVRHRKAGLVIIGKSNTPELGLVPTTESVLLGPARNPWNLGHTTGGSSGGAAAAVAAGMVPFAHASDGGGSIRIPASCCGLFGLKPTRGRNPLGPDIGDILQGLVVEHAITRSVRDSAILLDATEGMDLGAPYAAPAKARPYCDEVAQPPRRLRIAFSTKALTQVPVHADCVAAVDDTARLLVELGHEVVEDSLEFPGHEMVSQAFISLWAGGVVLSIDGLGFLLGKSPKAGDFEPLTWALYELGKSQNLSMYLLSVAHLQRSTRQVARKFAKYDAWLTPTLAEPPLPLGSLAAKPNDPLAGLWRAGEFCPFTPLANITGQPAMSVPLFWNSGGLPIGSHFIGRFGDEATLFQLAGQLERARPWSTNRPSLNT